MYSLSNLRRRAGRTGLTVTGVTLAISLMVVMFSVGNGVRDSARSILSDSGVDIFVQANGTSLGFAIGEFDNGRELANGMIAGNPEIHTAFPLLMYSLYGINDTMRQAILNLEPGDLPNLTKLSKQMKFKTMTLDGIIPDMVHEVGGVEPIAGPGFSRMDDPFYSNGTYAGGKGSPNFTHEMMINKVIKDQLKVGLDDSVYINPELPQSPLAMHSWVANATAFKVVRIVEASWEGMGSAIGYIHLSELQFISGKTNDTVNQILVDVKDPTEAQNVKEWIEKKYPSLAAFTVEDFLGEIEQVTEVFRGFGEMILLVTGVIVVLFVSTVMMMSVRERTAEIAALRAIGFSKRSIFLNILLEVFLIIIIGSIIGMIIGIGLAIGLDNYLIGLSGGIEGGSLPSGFHFVSITPILMVQMGAVALVFGLGCGLLPAAWAARMNIAQTLKHD